MKIIGVTGGVGSGKSKLIHYISSNYNAFPIYADLVGHELQRKGNINYDIIVDNFGTDILDNMGEIDSSKLRHICFSEPKKLEQIYDLTKENILKEIEKTINLYKEIDLCDIIILESAILFESNLNKYCDDIWYIYVHKEERIKRIMENRNYTKEMCEGLISKQLSDEQFKSRCNKIIDNSKNIDFAEKNIDDILQKCYNIRKNL